MLFPTGEPAMYWKCAVCAYRTGHIINNTVMVRVVCQKYALFPLFLSRYGHTALFINMYLSAQIFMPDNPVVGMLHRLEEQCLVQAKSLVMSFDLAESFDRMYCLRRNILNAVTRP